MFNDVMNLTGLTEYPFCNALITTILCVLMIFMFYRLFLTVFKHISSGI